MTSIERAWFQGAWWLWLLAPLMLIFKLVVLIRAYLFRINVLKSVTVDAPVIVVGNISVGGNGKTPVVLALCEWLLQAGYRPGVVSRGYGGSLAQDSLPHLVNAPADAALVGDEPALLAAKLQCPVVVDAKRSRGANYLIKSCACDVVICDDGLQHYRLQRDIEIVVIDAERMHGNGQMLPVGPLRESISRLNSVDVIIYNGASANVKQKALAEKQHLAEQTPREYRMSLSPSVLVNIAEPERTMPFSELLAHSKAVSSEQILAIAGIGNPKRFFALLNQQGLENIHCQAFADHHAFNISDLPSDDTMVLMTEKDAIKCRAFAKSNWWMVPVTTELPASFYENIQAQLVQHSEHE